MPLQIGQRLGDYEVQQMLGVGGMGHVYRVRNIISNRTEAMKVLLPDLTAEPDLATRFISEIRTLASFDHPNIAQLHTALIAENQLIMMMEYVEGYTLEQIAKQRTMPVGEVAGYISQALSALGYAHARGVVHRDVKPANLMVTSHGILKLMDFGIAKSNVENNNHTRPGTTLGSLYYMSPEQVRGDTVDARSDIYSVGIVLYEMLAGRRPFEAETTFTILNKQLNEIPQPPIELNPAIPAGLNAIILMALAKDPAQRFQNTEAFRNALKSYCASPDGQEANAAVAAAVAVPEATPVPSASSTPYGSSAPSSGPSSATSFAAPAAPFAAQQPPPSFTPVPSSPPAYAQTPPPQQQAFAAAGAAKPPRSNKPLWIATGAIAALLALVALGMTVPHWMKTRAAATTTTASSDLPALPPPPSDSGSSSSGTSTDQPAAVQSMPSGNAQPAAAQSSGQPSGPSHEEIQQMNERRQADERKQADQRVLAQREQAQADQRALELQQQQQPPRDRGQPREQEPPRENNAELLGQVQERMVQMDARASTARRQVQQVRSQQEAQGLGMRGDVESSESLLDSYLRAANNDIQRGDAIAARQDLNKAEPELKTLERFLGH